MKLNKKILAAALLMIGSASSAYAAHAVLPGGTVVPLYSATDLGGVLVDQATTYINNLSYQGWARTAVYKDTTTGYLDFVYQYQNDILAKNGVDRLTAFDFTGFSVKAFQTDDAFGIFTAGTIAADTVDRDLTGGVMGANFTVAGNGQITPGATSYAIIYRTDATAYTLGAFGIINGFASNAAGFAPAVPEPETYAMILVGLGLLGAAKRFKKTKV